MRPLLIKLIHGTFTFDGGSDRFQDTAGGGEISAEASFAPHLPFNGNLSGRIDY